MGDSHYNSLQVGLNRRFSHGLQGQLSYTWSKCIDNTSGTSGLEGGAPWTDPLAGNYDEGRCQFDRSQFVKFSSVYSFPFKGNVLVERVATERQLYVLERCAVERTARV